jgi:hypothetical protein
MEEEHVGWKKPSEESGDIAGIGEGKGTSKTIMVKNEAEEFVRDGWALTR